MPFFKKVEKVQIAEQTAQVILTYSDAYQLIKENIDEAIEFYELEPYRY